MTRLPLALAALIALTACEDGNTYVEPPPPKVTVAAPAVQEITDYLYFTGTSQAAAVVDIRARVPGALENISFAPGTFVQAGDPLFIIDQREYAADLEIAKAQLQSARAQKVEADKALARAEELIKRGNVSQAKLDEAEAAARSATADVAVKQAAVRQAELNLEYTDIRAPIEGRIGRNLVDAGNLVGQSEATHLATITDSDPMYVYFNINERDLLTVMERMRGGTGGGTPGTRDDFRVEMSVGGKEDYSFIGDLDFAESSLDPDTGTLELRARFANPADPEPVLLPGLFVRLRVPVAQRQDMPLVTERAIGLDQAGRYVYVVGAENVVEKRSIVTGQLIDGLRVVESGLAAGEKVVVNGIQRARGGAKVSPEEAEMTAFSASALKRTAQQASKAAAN
ncbi:efflux RND transporter periplasmic adaptor subunit [Pelagibius sp. CAU 1746]|uniref:efflux RND transporter periplasmic adaptor subunit n=1 Tax=Pelagibius sp. CAU 1746 TaxID=3140370 RepID=UPI00325B76E4